jgi:hypothetical protein
VHRERRALGAELIADCEAFLLGLYVERLESQRVAVPVWGWTNLLAHGNDAALRAAAAVTTHPGGADGWHAARARLAAELLRSGTLAELQRDVLAPLELRLASRPDVEGWGPRTWVDVVRAALRASPRP